MNKKFKLIVILPLFVLTFVSCVTVSNIGTDNWRDYFKPGSTKEEIAKDFNLYRGKWWNFYVRGRWYAEGGYYDEAIQDFKKSVSIRSRDQRSARSYGLHFWEYFVHRELGIVYYNQKKYGDAKKELEISLSTADSARAKFYLNKCNEEILKTTQADQEPPQIRISSHADGEIVNTQVVKLNGTAVDDCYVNCVYVQGKKLFTELAKRDLTFSENVSLRAGENAIDMEAVDLLGKNTKRSLKITLDVHPPILCLDEIQIRQKDGKQIATIKGIIVDDYALKDFFINDTEMHIESYKEEKFDKKLAWLKQLIDWQRQTPGAGSELKNLELFENTIYALTPKGDVIELPEKATVLDFAFAVHTELGFKCIRAVVNGKPVPLNFELKNGDTVQIFTSQQQKPRTQWLGFVKTSKAKAKIKQRLNIKQAKKTAAKPLRKQVVKTSDKRIRIANCCNPLLGEEIVGFKTTKRKISVHRKSCLQLNSIPAEKLINVEWEHKQGTDYIVELKVTGKDRVGEVNCGAHFARFRATCGCRQQSSGIHRPCGRSGECREAQGAGGWCRIFQGRRLGLRNAPL